MKTLENLGTEKHMGFYKRAEDCKDIGCFALTELAHGSNVKGMQTTATFDKKSFEFIINTPTVRDMKWWIGGSAKQANLTVVFAQLYVEGKKHGVHAFVVPIRNLDDHELMPGVTIGDCGEKIGVEGVDNGFLHFNNVRIPYDNLLDRLSQIDADGKF